MNCTKTGCHVFLASHGEYLYGDAFESDDKKTVVFRVVDTSRKPLADKIHYTVVAPDQWFDKETKATSTLIASAYINYGYEGKAIASLKLVEGGS